MVADKRSIRRVQLAQKILRLAHQSEWQRGHHLTEQKLCAQLGISRSPLRAALGLLVEWGAVAKRPNQGFFLEGDTSELLTLGREAPPTVEEDLHLAIVDARLSRRIGDTVTQVELMSLFDRPRSVVERVLLRMVHDGLMERLSERGWRFLSTFEDSQSWETSYQFRLLLEPGGILFSQFEVDQEKLSSCRLAHLDLLTAIEAGREPASWIYRIDSDFHELIASFGKNVFFLQAVQNQNRLRQMWEYRGYGNRRRVADWCHEHLAIIASLERGQFAQSAELMRRHLENGAAVTKGLAAAYKTKSKDGSQSDSLRARRSG